MNKQDKKIISISAASLLGLAIIAFISITNRGVAPEDAFITFSGLECSEYTFSCPQFHTQFEDGEICGCAPTGSKEDPNPDSRNLLHVIDRHLASKVLTAQEGEVTVAKYNHIKTVDLLGDGKYGDPVSVEIWADVKKFTSAEEGEVEELESYSGPMQVIIEQPGKMYIVTEAKTFEEGVSLESFSESSQEALAEYLNGERDDYLNEAKMLLENYAKRELAKGE